MGSAVAVVTDSSSYLPPDLADPDAVTIVPLQLAVGGDVRDEDTTTTAETARALREQHRVTTSRPSPSRFAAAYADAAGSGASAVVSVHLSASMSGTVEAARLAAADAPVPVHVVDSGTIGMGLGFAVLSAVAKALDGGSPAEVVAAAERRAALTRSLFYVDNLEHLRRSGRIGAAANLLGSALMVKPLLDVSSGRITPLEKVRTTSRALARLADLAVTVAEAAGRPVDLGIQHLAASARAETLAADLRNRVPNVADLHIGEVGPVIGAHVGPGMLGVVVAPLP
ncbi:DegV family protein [Actinomadura harenae]|uniref:DegV family protein n=1 Tax=Actinomadura harenae TaxID=2483351 RepID=A0A3M2MBG8_9ACTN|nr:DegV family protein [Actinomadura harenae]RMI47134.1 DegV family protein [Actinomadura harenae]